MTATAQAIRSSTCTGDIPSVYANDAGLYEGTLEHYLNVVFDAPNAEHPYHNTRHMTHVTWLCHDACCFYQDEWTPRQMRNLLIAASFHDYGHSGTFGYDYLNIERALHGLKDNILPEDKEHLDDIVSLIKPTEFPYTIPSEALTDLRALVLRDADVSQSLSIAWIQQVLIGLAREWKKPVREVLLMQEPFLSKLTFHTSWARHRWPNTDIQSKIREAQRLVSMLKAKPPMYV
jgi:hypothetical protein